MIGLTVMEIGEQEMEAAIEYYLNRSVLHHTARVIGVRQRSNGRFVIEFDGQPEVERLLEERQRAARAGGD